MLPQRIPILQSEWDEDEAAVATEKKKPVRWKRTRRAWRPTKASIFRRKKKYRVLNASGKSSRIGTER